MSMQDPISDMLTRIRNGQKSSLYNLIISFSQIKFDISKVMWIEGYLKEVNQIICNKKKYLEIQLKYFKGRPVIEEIIRISKPSLRIYKTYKNLPNIMGGLGVAILSTSKGVMSNIEAKKRKIGGEIICHII